MSFDHVPEWIRQFQNLKVDAPIAIVGNKLDLDRQCQRREAQGLARATSDLELTRSDAFYEHSVDDSLTRKISVDALHRLAEKHNAMFMEVSAKTQFQVEEMFRIVTDGILEHQRRQQLAGMEYGVEVGVTQPRKRKCCS
ncbi:uncharacterized protein LOC106168083 [Lingula anatina]|uniref:Uncharacterized protein LOC106168083 n=1 Tax=Lingula anatina TaxID=7574 RepID=A0A1S3IWA2_LINAN|nr:uncharacterized protein LOC106168083 [Lingula anatina]|eukprot:XP_013402467.1 uncharacterized protein LOC106168083 [Lingula anatina]